MVPYTHRGTLDFVHTACGKLRIPHRFQVPPSKQDFADGKVAQLVRSIVQPFLSVWTDAQVYCNQLIQDESLAIKPLTQTYGSIQSRKHDSPSA